MGSRRTLTVLMFVILATWAAWVRIPFPGTGIDDANIFFVYARNLSAGEGFVFNPGGERVEGFTSLLWVLICAGAVALAGEPERLLLILNVLLVCFTVVLCLRSFVLAANSDPDRFSTGWKAAFLLLLLSDRSYITWNTIALMETALWGGLLIIAALAIVDEDDRRNRRPILAAIVATLVITRPEALLWGPVLIALFYFRTATATTWKRALRQVIPLLIIYACTAGLLTIFRVVYFGFPLPNTYYAKVSPSLTYRLTEGIAYVQSYLASAPAPFASGVAIVLSAVHLVRVRFRDSRTFVLTAVGLTGLAVPVLSGGDHFDGFRFYQSVYPLLLLSLLNFARFILPEYVGLAAQSRVRRNMTLAVGASVIGLFLALQTLEWLYPDHRPLLGTEFEIAAEGRQRGYDANAVFGALEPRPSIGTITVGGLKYAYSGDVTDLMGLNNTRMAHNGGNRIGIRSHAAFEKRTFYELNPTIVLPIVRYRSGLFESSQKVWFVGVALKGLLDDTQFRETYQLAEIRKATANGGETFVAWYDRTFLTRLAQSDEFQIVMRP